MGFIDSLGEKNHGFGVLEHTLVILIGEFIYLFIFCLCVYLKQLLRGCYISK